MGTKRPRSSTISENNDEDEPRIKSPPKPAAQKHNLGDQIHLPVHHHKKQLLDSILKRPQIVTLVVSETGSGKSTQIPAYLLDSVHRIAVTQPRRVAAVTLASRVAKERSYALGRQVGYRVRFDDRTTADTQLMYCTDGMLLREAMVDPALNRYSVVFLDEAHERSLQTDVLIGVVQRARKQRATGHRPLKVVVMSATLDSELFEAYFERQTELIRIPGRQFRVQVLYAAEEAGVEEYAEATLSTILQVHDHEADGDILAFLPGQEEIEDVAAMLRRQLHEDEQVQWTGDKVIRLNEHMKESAATSPVVNGVQICLLYAALPPAAQLAAFAPKPPGCRRKVVLATNIAETSVTLPAIRYVIDCGKHKCRRALATGMETLQVENISQAQADQRAGRAGRVMEGLCFRLYTERAFRSDLDPTGVPEIMRANLSQVVLQLLSMGVPDLLAFEFVTPPDAAGIQRALRLLHALGAVNDDMQVTAYGTKLAKLPLDPVFGHLLLVSAEHKCVKEMLTAVAVLSSENLLYRPSAGSAALSDHGKGTSVASKAAAAHRRFTSHEGDLPTFLNVYRAWRHEAAYHAPDNGSGRHRKGKNSMSDSGPSSSLLSHGEWCQRNFVSGRALARAHSIRRQLEALCAKSLEQNGLGLDTSLSSGKDREAFLKCVAAGLFLQAASRIKYPQVDSRTHDSGNKGRSGLLVPLGSRGRYRTKIGNDTVSIHPTSAMFGRNPPPACVVYTELVTTKKTYIRGVTQIREEWLHDVAPTFYPKKEDKTHQSANYAGPA